MEAGDKGQSNCGPAAGAGAVGAVSSSRAEAVMVTGAAISAETTAASTEIVAAGDVMLCILCAMVLLQRRMHTVQLRELREGLRYQCQHETVCQDGRQSDTGQVVVPPVWIVRPLTPIM
jgi:hypothetical protein